MKKNTPTILLFVTFLIVLTLFNTLSTKVLLADTEQYISVAKEFANTSITKPRFTSWVYGFFLGQFLKINNSLLILHFVNMIWFLLIFLLIYKITKSNKSLILFIFSPLVWYLSIWINPILPVTFFLLLAYQQLKLFEKSNNYLNFVISALSLGLLPTLWIGGIYIYPLFILAFFYNKIVRQTFTYFIISSITLLIRPLLDLYYFGNPFISLLRGIGANFYFFFNKNPEIATHHPTFLTLIFLSLLISPVLYKLYKIKVKENINELFFLSLIFIFYILNFQYRLFFLILPFLIILLTKFVTKKDLIIHALTSIIVIILIVQGPLSIEGNYFGKTEDFLISQDLKQLEEEFPNQSFIVGTEGVSEEQALFLDTLYSGKNIKEFIRYSEYKLSLKNETIFKEYNITTKPKVNDSRKIDFSVIYSRTDNRTYEDIKYLIIIGDKGEPPENSKFLKKYNVLRLFEK
mgnify:CR=1 FL=1